MSLTLVPRCMLPTLQLVVYNDNSYDHSLPQDGHEFDAPIYYSTIGYGPDYSDILEQVSPLL